MPKIQFNQSQVDVSLLGGQMSSWTIGQVPILYSGSSLKRSGMPILFPFAGPLDDDIFKASGGKISQHGFARDTVWEAIQGAENELSLFIDQSKISPENQVSYPYQFKCQITYKLLSENTLAVSLQIANKSQVELPTAPGFHPYFNLPKNCRDAIKLPAKSELKDFENIWETEHRGIWTEFENGENFDLKNFSLKIVDDSSASKHLLVWTQPDTFEDCEFICLEPLTKRFNEINTNPILLAQNQVWTWNLKFEAVLTGEF